MKFPIYTDQGGELDDPVLMCAWEADWCPHLSVFDSHQYYCNAQPDTAPHLRKGAGTHLWWVKPNEGCPYLKGKYEMG